MTIIFTFKMSYYLTDSVKKNRYVDVGIRNLRRRRRSIAIQKAVKETVAVNRSLEKPCGWKDKVKRLIVILTTISAANNLA